MSSDLQNYINHVALVLDESWSMSAHQRDLIAVADGQIQHLAKRSQELDQETRVSIYTFASTVKCRVFDKDVLRLPSIAKLYDPNGRTALIDATIKSQEDLAQTAQMYGDHAFLTFVLTDGEENESRATGSDLRRRLGGLSPHWTVACLVPHQYSKHEAQGFGFPADNIAIWDPSTAAGVTEAGSVIRQATENFMTGRAKGVRGTRALFSTGIDAVNEATVRSALDLLDPNSYQVLPVARDTDIKAFFAGHPVAFRQGANYYQFTKRETIQANKKVLVREKATGHVYGGQRARELLGLQLTDIRDKPGYNPEYDIYVQSTSPNRKLMGGTDLLVLR